MHNIKHSSMKTEESQHRTKDFRLYAANYGNKRRNRRDIKKLA